MMRTAVRHAAILFALLIGAAALSHAQTYRAVDIEAEEQKAELFIAERIAVERARFAPDARPLASDSALTKIARERSGEMAEGAPFAHEDEQGRFAAAGKVHVRFGPYGAIGENIVLERDSSGSFEAEAFARRAVQNWMNSEGHRAAILSPLFDRNGVGVVFKGTAAYATQVFWGPPKQAAARVFGTRRRR